MSYNTMSLAFTAGFSFFLGLFVYSQGAKKPQHIYLALLSLSISMWCFGQFMGGLSQKESEVLFWTRFNIGSAVFIPIFFLNFILEFTNSANRSRGVLRSAYSAAFIFIILDFTKLFVASVAPTFSYKYYPTPGIAYPFFAVYILTIFIFGSARLMNFTKQSFGQINNQAKYVLFASIIGFLGGATAFFPVFGINLPVVTYLALPIYLSITIYAILKHKLLDISLVIREGLLYSLLTLLFAGFYTFVILSVNNYLKDFARLDEFTATIFIVFVSVVVFTPVRSWLQRMIDKIFYQGSYYYQKTITDLSAENLQLYKGLLQADKLSSLGTIAAGMAHEIKNPLASIKGLTQILPENLDDKEFIGKYHDIVPRQLDRINKIVEDLLEFGQPSSMMKTQVNICEQINSILNLLGAMCINSNIAVEKKYCDVCVYGDEEKLHQAFMNVILNAVQSMPNGGTLKIIILQSNKGMAAIEISDSGNGIEEDNMQKIFDPFFTTKDGGSGMGLAVTYRIIKEHGGKIEVASKRGEGTTFKIWLYTKQKE